MMLRFILTALLSLLLATAPLTAQVSVDPELKSLISVVSRLRQAAASGQQDLYQNVQAELSADESWTPMDELRRHAGECLPADKSVGRFRLNGILNGIQRDRDKRVGAKQQMLSGEDANYNYSLLEKTVRARQTVTYSFHGRQGLQTFVLVPYKPGQKISARLRRGKEELGKTVSGADGNLYLRTRKGVALADQLTLEIKNEESEPAAFVILNHNTRSK